jgi:hypothetical protein
MRAFVAFGLILILVLAAAALVEIAGRSRAPVAPPPDDAEHCGVAIVRFTAEWREAKLPPPAAGNRTAAVKAHADFAATSRYLARARRCTAQACDTGDVASCRMLRRITTDFGYGGVSPKVAQRIEAADLDERFKRLAERTYPRLERDCARGDGDACFERGASSWDYARRLQDSRKRRETARAKHWLGKACSRDHVDACLQLRDIAQATSDAIETAEMFQRACLAAARQKLPAPEGCEVPKVH